MAEGFVRYVDCDERTVTLGFLDLGECEAAAVEGDGRSEFHALALVRCLDNETGAIARDKRA